MYNDDGNPNYWCSFQAYEDQSIIIEYVVLGSLIIIFAVMIYAYIQAKKQNQFSYLSEVYKIIIAWLICTSLWNLGFFVKTLINIIAYEAFIQFSPKNTSNTTNVNGDVNFVALKVLSSLFLFLDVTTTFFLQMAMIYIPYKWTKNALQLLIEQDISYQQRITIRKISYGLFLIKKYLIIRNIYLLYFLAVSISISLTDGFNAYGTYIRSIVSLIQAVVIMFIYPIGFKTFSVIKKRLNLGQKQEKSILTEYFSLLICNLVRIILNSGFYFSQLTQYDPDEYCYDNHDAGQTKINCIFLSLGLILMHIVPGCIILYVYWPPKRQKQDLKNSLLVSQTRYS